MQTFYLAVLIAQQVIQGGSTHKHATCEPCVCLEVRTDAHISPKLEDLFGEFSAGDCAQLKKTCGGKVEVLKLTDFKEQDIISRCDSAREGNIETTDESNSNKTTETAAEETAEVKTTVTPPSSTSVAKTTTTASLTTQTAGTTEVIPIAPTQDTPITFDWTTKSMRTASFTKGKSNLILTGGTTTVTAAAAAVVALFGTGFYALSYLQERSGSDITNSQPSFLHESSGGEEEIAVTLARTDML